MNFEILPFVMLPFEPENFEAMKQRWGSAVAGVIEADKVKSGEQAYPGTNRANVFDFQDGVRMIVSRELLKKPLDRVTLHISFGVIPVFQPLWVSLGAPRFVSRCEEILNGLKPGFIAGTIAHTTQTMRARHYWFEIV